MPFDLSALVEQMVGLGLQAAEHRRGLDQIAEKRRAALCAWIVACPLTPYAIAKRIGYTKQHLSLITRGHTMPSDELYARVFDLHRELVTEEAPRAEG